MGWWPFGRKRRKERQQQAIETKQSITSPASARSVHPSQRADPFSDNNQIEQASSLGGLNEKAPMASPIAQPQERTDYNGQTPATTPSKRGGAEKSPRFRPISASDVNSSASPRSHKVQRDDERVLHNRLSNLGSINMREYNPSTKSTPVRFATNAKQNPASDRLATGRTSTVSPPMSSSKFSTMTGLSDLTRFNVGSLDILSPRPTIRYSFQGDYRPGASLVRLDKRPFSRRTLEDSKTIDDLADELDARSIRELMDRDQRRRERRRRGQESKVRRKPERHINAAKIDTSLNFDQPPESLKPGPYLVGIPLEYQAEAGPSRHLGGGAQFAAFEPADYETRNPFADPIPDISPENFQPPSPVDTLSTPFYDPVLQTAQTVRYSQASMSPPSSPFQHARNISNLSQIPDLRSVSMTEVTEMSEKRQGSESFRRGGPLAALFRRSASGMRGSEDRGQGAPSEASFSNTSRESMIRQLPPPHLRERPMTPKVLTNPPLRTKSIFMEDLPDLPLSPPDSRLQSPAIPELEEAPPLPEASSRRLYLQDSPLQRAQSPRESYDSAGQPTTGLIPARSLASMDSEASWLSGKQPNRISERISAGRLSIPKRSLGNKPSEEDLSTMPNLPHTQDTYAYPAMPSQNSARKRLTGLRAALADDDDTSSFNGDHDATTPADDDQVVHGEVVRKNTIIHRGSRVRSAEGLLNQWGGEEPVTPPRRSMAETDDSPGGLVMETPYLEKAHARHLSVGSARLLDIPARSESQRSSVALGSPGSPIGGKSWLGIE